MEPTVIDTALAQALAAQYPSMRSLDLRSNNIVAIHDLQPLSQLQELALDGNRLTTLEGLASLQWLTSLSARSNLITHLGGAITALSSLRVLDLAWNRMAPGPWVSLLARLPRLTDLDLRGNPLCDLEGGTQMLAAALPGLQRLNGELLPPAASPRTQTHMPATFGDARHATLHPLGDSPPPPHQQQLQLQQPGAGVLAPAGRMLLSSGQPRRPDPPGWHSLVGQEEPGGAGPAPPGPQAPPPAAAAAYRGEAAGHQPVYAAEVLQSLTEGPHSHQSWVRPPEPPAPAIGGGAPGGAGPEREGAVAVLQLQLEAAARAQEALSAAHEALRGEHERLGQRAASLEDALRQAEAANARLHHQLQQQSTSSAQQVAGLAGQVGALIADRDAAVRQAELLAERLAEAEARGEEAARAASAAAQQVSELQAATRVQEQELRATQELLLSLQHHQLQLQEQQQHQQHLLAAESTTAAEEGAGGRAPPGQRGTDPEGRLARSPGAAGAAAQPPGAPGAAAARLEAALQQRVATLQQVVWLQERELVRLGGLASGPPPGSGGAGGVEGSASAHPVVDPAGWDNVLQPWREQVATLHERLGRLAAEGEEQRAEWGRQLGEMREQFTQARTLLEVLEQRSREQRSENSQLQARVAQLGGELQAERRRAAGLEQQVASRESAAQAVRRQLLAFQAHMEQREAALEGRAGQLAAQAERLSHATRRLTFALGLAAAVRGRGPGGANPAAGHRTHHQQQQQQAALGGYGPMGLYAGALLGEGGPSHVALPGLLAASPAAKRAMATSAGWIPDRGLGLPASLGEDFGRGAGGGDCGGGGGAAGSRAGGEAAEEAPLLGVLRQEVARLGRDREMLLQRLAQVSSSAEERIRGAQAAAEEREGRQREALLAARVQAAQQAVEAEAERKVRSAESATAAQSDEVRRLVQAATEAAEELCRRTEAAAGVRLSRMAVRLQDLAKQVDRLRGVRRRAADELRTVGGEVERLRQELAASRAAEGDLRRQLASRDREAHARVAELRADQEEALAAERRRTAEAERLAAKAAAECGQLERQLVRVREVRGQQEDAKLRRLQSQLHEQEALLRSLRRERNALLGELRKYQAAPGPYGSGSGSGRATWAAAARAGWDEREDLADTAALDDAGWGERDTGSEEDPPGRAAGSGAPEPGASSAEVLPLRPNPRHSGGGGAADAAPPTTQQQPQQQQQQQQQHLQQHPHLQQPRVVSEPFENPGAATAAVRVGPGAPAASSIRSILRGGAPVGLPVGVAVGSGGRAAVEANAGAPGRAPQQASSSAPLSSLGGAPAGPGTGAAPGAGRGPQAPGARAGLEAGEAGVPREGPPGGHPDALQRLAELEALTEELLSLD